MRIASAGITDATATQGPGRRADGGVRHGARQPRCRRPVARSATLTQAGPSPNRRFAAGVAQWQSESFPSSRRGFDSLHPLQRPRSRTAAGPARVKVIPRYAAGYRPETSVANPSRSVQFATWAHRATGPAAKSVKQRPQPCGHPAQQRWRLPLGRAIGAVGAVAGGNAGTTVLDNSHLRSCLCPAGDQVFRSIGAHDFRLQSAKTRNLRLCCSWPTVASDPASSGAETASMTPRTAGRSDTHRHGAMV